MNRFFLTALMCLSLVGSLLAQSTQRGIVYEYHETKKKTPLANVEIQVGSASSTVTNEKGEFVLHFKTLKPGDRVMVRQVRKKGYEVLNPMLFAQWYVPSDEKTPYVIVMCRTEKLEELRRLYRASSERSVRTSYEKEVIAINKVAKKNSMSKEEKDRQLNALRHRYDTKLENLDFYIEQFVRLDLESLDKESRKIGKLVSDGQFDKALQLYERLDLLNKYDQKQHNMQRLSSDVSMLHNLENQYTRSLDSLKRSLSLYVNLLEIKGGAANHQKAFEVSRFMADMDTADIFQQVACAMKERNYGYTSDAGRRAYGAWQRSKGNKQSASYLIAAILYAETQAMQGRIPEAYELFLDSYHKLDSMRLQRIDTLHFLPELAQTLNHIAQCEVEMKKYDEAYRHFQQGVHVYETLRSHNIHTSDADFATHLVFIGALLKDTPYSATCIPNMLQSVAMLDTLNAKKPNTYAYLFGFAHHHLAEAYSQLGPDYRDLSEKSYLMADSLYRHLAFINPQYYERFLCSNLLGMGRMYGNGNQLSKSISCLREAEGLAETVYLRDSLRFVDYGIDIYSALVESYHKNCQYNLAVLYCDKLEARLIQIGEGLPDKYRGKLEYIRRLRADIVKARDEQK